MAKIYERSLSTIIAQGKFRDSFDPRSQTLSGEESTWKGDRLEIPCVVDCFFFIITRLTCFGCFTLDVLFHQASVKIKLSTLSVHCCTTLLVSSTEECLLAFHSVCYVLFRDKRGSLRQENAMKSHDKTQT